jgi:7,8-dihydropterin-6-yl-methyl-4-(beta-D-ribofuranosyl)aminobenzene 5'-phosphate synthase
MTTGDIPLVTYFYKIEPSLYVQSNDDWKPDPLLDDLSLLINTKNGLVVILGCAHRGMINTLYRARTIARNRKIHLVIGGSHLKDAAEEQVWQTISSLNELGVQKLGVSHCTGMPPCCCWRKLTARTLFSISQAILSIWSKDGSFSSVSAKK